MDEAHRIKNENSLLGQVAAYACPLPFPVLSERMVLRARFALSGTECACRTIVALRNARYRFSRSAR